MNTIPNDAKLAEIATDKEYALDPEHFSLWQHLDERTRKGLTAGMTAAREALFAGVEGFPSIEEMINAFHGFNLPGGCRISAVRNLMLAAFVKREHVHKLEMEAVKEEAAKQVSDCQKRMIRVDTEAAEVEQTKQIWIAQHNADAQSVMEKDTRITQLEAKLNAVKALPEKWSKGPSIRDLECAQDLETALSTPSTEEVKPENGLKYRISTTTDNSTLHEFLGGVESCCVDVYPDDSVVVIVRDVSGKDHQISNKKAWEEVKPEVSPVPEIPADTSYHGSAVHPPPGSGPLQIKTGQDTPDPSAIIPRERLLELCGGREPHRFDFTWEMLKDGERPAYLGEYAEDGDVWIASDGNRHSSIITSRPVERSWGHTVTSRPLPAAPVAPVEDVEALKAEVARLNAKLTAIRDSVLSF